MVRNFLLAPLLAVAELAACSPGSSDAGPAADAGVDGAGLDADARVDGADGGDADAACTGVMCNGSCIPATDCRTCPGAPLLCASSGECAAACNACNSKGNPMPIECFACDSNHENPIGTCQYDDAGSYCLSGDYLGQYLGGNGYQCECSNVTQCPGATQVCVPLGNYDAGFCLTCGESTVGMMQGLPCKDGGACQVNQTACE